MKGSKDKAKLKAATPKEKSAYEFEMSILKSEWKTRTKKGTRAK